MQYWHYKDPGVYVRFHRDCMEALKAGRKVRINGGDSLDMEGFKREVRKALDKRINLKGGRYEDGGPVGVKTNRLTGKTKPIGRRFDPMYQTEMIRDAHNLRAILSIRLRVYQFQTDIFRGRFAHLLSHYDD